MGLIHDQYMSWLELRVENERLRARIAELEALVVVLEFGSALASIVSATEANPAAVDPDVPRRFRWPETGQWPGPRHRHGAYFPANNLWVGGMGNARFGIPAMPGLEWIDEAPAGKGAVDVNP